MELKNILSFSDKKKSIVKTIKKEGMSAVCQYFKDNNEYFYKIAWAYVQNHHDVEDIFQNTIINAYEHINQLKKEKYFKTWVTSILINECKKVLKYKRKNVSGDYLEIKNLYEEDSIEYDENKMELFLQLKKLDSKNRDVIILKYYGGYTGEEISQILDIPIGTVKSRIHRGLLVLRESMKSEEV